MSKVVIENLYKIYSSEKKEEFIAVDDFNLEIEDREFIVLVGPSGCGKSTTLRMIAGLEEISKGTIRIDDRVINAVPPKDRDIAMVFQNYALYPHMSVEENMSFGLRLRNFAKKTIEERIKETAEILGLSPEMLKRRPKALSGGQRQRVALGRAIVRKPKAFLFDEPLSNLDAKMRVQMRMEISSLHKRLSSTMIYVTHDQVEAMTMGDRIVVMKDGFIQQTDTPLNIYHYPVNMFVGSFIGNPSMNFFEGKIIEKDARLYFAQKESPSSDLPFFSLLIDETHTKKLAAFIDQPIFMGIRPEHITLSEEPSLQTLQGTLNFIEPMGAQTYLYLKTASEQLIMQSSSVAAFPSSRLGENLTLQVMMDRAHFFDPASQEKFKKPNTQEIDIEAWQAASPLVV